MYKVLVKRKPHDQFPHEPGDVFKSRNVFYKFYTNRSIDELEAFTVLEHIVDLKDRHYFDIAHKSYVFSEEKINKFKKPEFRKDIERFYNV